MKFYTVINNGVEAVMAQPSGQEKIFPLAAFGIKENYSMNDLIRNYECIQSCFSNEPALDGINLDSVELLAPIPHPSHDVLCLGLNYAKHMEEAVKFHQEAFEREATYPVYFSKRVNEALRPGGKIKSFPNIMDSLDYETEVAVILSKDAFEVEKDNAFDYVFGYTIVNDVSARNLQTRHKQWYLGKSLDTFTPMGPCIVTKDEFTEPPVMNIKTYINGELRQDGSTSLLLFDIAHVISEVSQGMTLEAGTIIAMGTPAGVGMGFKPPKFLKTGDVVRSEVEGIGILENTVD
ncbi:MAG: fumarylacetoacetate hydrolase family protein [Oscillospiraceae bacterium]|nr:fumarylacetoacetate hydrolase family protein [Oscillospiraceae bacterium]